jgi:hypothetical protein
MYGGEIYLCNKANSMYSSDKTNTTEPYMVLALRGLPKSFFITRKGKMVIK